MDLDYIYISSCLLLVGLGSQCDQAKVEIAVGLIDVLFLNDASNVLR